MAQIRAKVHTGCGIFGNVARQTALLACFCSSLLFASSAVAPYRFFSWTTENGLPQNSIQALLQTRDGYLWLSTLDGLVRFDGVQFEIFNRQNTPALTDNSFTFFALLEDRKGCLWAGTLNGGAVRYCNGTFSSLTVKDGLPNNTVIRIDQDQEGAIWIFTDPGLTKWQNGHLIRVAPEPGSSFNPYLSTPKDNVGVDGALFGLWRMEAHGWQRFAYGRWSPFPLPFPLKDPSKLHILSGIEDSRHRFWYRLAGSPDVYCVDGGNLFRYSGIPPEYFVTYKDRRGYLWAYSATGRCIIWKDGRSITLPDFSTPFMFRVLEDQEGTVWIGTAKEGLHRADLQMISVYQHPNGSQWNIVQPVLQDRAGNVWFGSRMGLSRFSNGKFVDFYHSDEPNKRMDWQNIVSAIYEDRDGTIWAGTWTGLSKLKGSALISDLRSKEIQGYVNAILRDRNGDLWVGGGEGGLYRIHGDQCIPVNHADGLANDTLHAQVIFEDHKGTLWIGSSNGLARFDRGHFSMLPAAAGLSVTALYEDAADVLWIGTYDSGLARLEGDKFTRYTQRAGLFNNGVFQILEDDRGFLWLSCHLGIYRVNKRQLNEFAAGRISLITSPHFGKADGLLSVECSRGGQPTGFKAHDGKLWFPTSQGLAVVDPKAVALNSVPPPVVIEGLSVDGHSTNFRAGVVIKPRQENLEIQYTALSWSSRTRFVFGTYWTA